MTVATAIGAGRRTLVAALAVSAIELAAPAARAQGITLRLHPHVGDTLHTRLDQQTEVTATMRGPSGGAPTTRTVTTSIALHSRTIVQASSPASTLVLTMVDSIQLHSTDPHSAEQVAQAEQMLRRQQLLLQLATDGTVEGARDVRGVALPQDLADAMAMMPAVFPGHPVKVGDAWTRAMSLPSGGPLGARGAGHVNAVFRLDSLDRSGNLAYVSMRGDIVTDRESEGVRLSGVLNGSMLVDRVRGWMTDSRCTVLLRSAVTPAPSTGLAPMWFVTKVTQRLRTMDKR
jgi:hypothetical protein